ncbi:MAG: flap endonuclease-1 [Candidatus Anstonellaceae archaeon]
MGCDLSSLLDPSSTSLEALSNKKLAIDGNNILYQFLSSIRQPDGSLLMDSKGNITAHLSGLFYRTIKWLENGILPIFIFDGKPPSLKESVLLERQERKEIAKEKFTQAIEEGDLSAAFSFAQQTSKLTPQMIEQAKELLQAMGVPYLQAPSEGEAQAAYLVKQNLAWAVASQDYDSLLFGAQRLIRNLSFSGKRKVPKKNMYVSVDPEIIELDKELNKLGISYQQLIWIAILIGTDFNPGVYKVGPKTAFKIVKNSKSFDEAKDLLIAKFSERKEEIIEALKNYKEIEEFFISPPIEKAFNIEFREPDNQKIISILVDKYEFSLERVEKSLSELSAIKKEKKSQSKLDSFF